jgi:hypothetical protein
MNRRQFLVRATIGGATVPLLFTEIGCSDDDDDNGNGGPGGSETFTSNNVNGHTHSITIPDSDLTAGGGHNYTSTNVQGHTHQVSLDSVEIDNLTAGCVVVATSSNNSGHEHTWRIVVADFVSNIIVTSSLVDNHQHQVTVPANGLLAEVPVSQNLTTTAVLSHQHILTLDPGDWTLLQECSSVTKSTNPDGTGHAHSFTITRA